MEKKVKSNTKKVFYLKKFPKLSCGLLFAIVALAFSLSNSCVLIDFFKKRKNVYLSVKQSDVRHYGNAQIGDISFSVTFCFTPDQRSIVILPCGSSSLNSKYSQNGNNAVGPIFFIEFKNKEVVLQKNSIYFLYQDILHVDQIDPGEFEHITSEFERDMARKNTNFMDNIELANFIKSIIQRNNGKLDCN